ncbi:traB family domain-containing protein [Ditylenchus destructor]|uniref:TraB family domain-containing protein n=1 Tax=Ditylenchus destructor TaxID=166010 RepID=A0AAD4NFC6_9BILA|nr:traB family domain-containing protein [Ditylenchus destructor]
MDVSTISAPQDNPDATKEEAKRHRQQIGNHQLESPSQEVASPSVSNGATRVTSELTSSNSYGHLNPFISDPATELTEDDIFRMKRLRLLDGPPGTENQSAVSVVDSASNFEEHNAEIGEDDVDENIPYDTDDEGENKHIRASMTPPQVGPFGTQSESAVMSKSKASSHVVICGDYVFNRARPENPILNTETVTVLNYPFEPLMVPEGEDVVAYSKCFKDAKVYLVGTAHFSVESQQDVLKTILQTQPDVVMVELCSSRISILSMDEQTLLREAKSLNRERVINIIRQSGVVQGILHVLLLTTSAHITRQLGMAPGGEFRAAHNGSLQVQNCRIVLGDRPVQITLQRALSALGIFQKLRLFYHILLSNRASITQEDVERCKNKDLLEEILKEMAGEFPQLSKIFVDERDQYMAHILHILLQRTTAEKLNACRQANVPYEPVNIVAVVGIGHVSGIVANWNRHIDGTELLTVPMPSRKAKIVKWMFKATFFGMTAYACYRFSRFAANKMISGKS